MEAKRIRRIASGIEYDPYFPTVPGQTFTIKKDAALTDTLEFIPRVIPKIQFQTKEIAEKVLKGASVYETCSNIWRFVYRHIQYKRDQKGYEQVRSPARAWRDRRSGVDCDCYSVFISSILCNLGIPHLFRITEYEDKGYYQHIYPVVTTSTGEIILDCVTNSFNYEVPYSNKKDYPMDLQFLNGIDSMPAAGSPMGAAVGNVGELGKAARRPVKPNGEMKRFFRAKAAQAKNRKAASSNATQPSTSAANPAPKKKKGFKKFISKINKFNPATILLRTGVLASMKLNIANVAKRLRWSYLSQEQAGKQGIDAQKFQKLIATRQKLENIFEVAGGKASNLKKAILKGKGNKDHAVVAGLEGMEGIDMGDYTIQTPLSELLGLDMLNDENPRAYFQGFGELGEPTTLASVAAAAGVVATIVSQLKSIGDIFGGKGKGSADFDENANAAAEKEAANTAANASADDAGAKADSMPAGARSKKGGFSKGGGGKKQRGGGGGGRSGGGGDDDGGGAADSADASPEDGAVDPALAPGSSPTSPAIATASVIPANINVRDENPDPPEKKGFWDKNKKWLKPTLIGAGGIAVIAVGYHLFKSHHPPALAPDHAPPLTGTPKKKKHKKPKHRHKQHPPKKAVALL